jgi:hypothetical protein
MIWHAEVVADHVTPAPPFSLYIFCLLPRKLYASQFETKWEGEGQPGPSSRKAAMTITDDIYRLWCALAPSAQMPPARMPRSAQHEPGTDKPSGKHRADSTRRPYAPVGRTGRRIYRLPSHRAQ